MELAKYPAAGKRPGTSSGNSLLSCPASQSGDNTVRMAENGEESCAETILLVDDNTDLLSLFSTVLTHKGYNVLTADGGAQCVSVLLKQIPDLVLLDIMMEPVDGWEVLSSIRENPATHRLPVIMVTGKQPTREEILHHLAEIDGYIVKPITIAELLHLVSTCFQRQKRIDALVEEVRTAGASQTMVEEYRQLCRMVAAGSALTRIIPELATDIDTIMTKARKKLDTIRHECLIQVSGDSV